MLEGWKKSDRKGIIQKYLEKICSNHNGSLDAYRAHFKDEYLKEIEKRVQVFLTDKGLLDLPDSFDPAEFKAIMEQVIINFKENNKEQFKIGEEVDLFLEVKNVPELMIKIFQINTETYYKNKLSSVSSDINLQGMMPSFLRVEKELFKGIPKNKIVTHKFTFDELKDKVGLFVIEF